MQRPTVNLGILAHVDAGKTTLTERLLYAAGVIDEPGRVDAGTTQTDTLELERQRGITIKSAVASFAIADTRVNLIDTPGHPDFIAEVERVLSVLDGAVLVISAVEGVQPQTRILMRALQRLRIPTLIFVNKIDRPGAGDARILAAIAERLSPALVVMGHTDGLGTRDARFTALDPDQPAARVTLTEALADRDEQVLAAYVQDDRGVPWSRLQRALVEQTRQTHLYPVYFGSAITGAGVDVLSSAIVQLLPKARGESDAPTSGRVFKIERSDRGEKIAYVRLSSGELRTRDRLQFGDGRQETVTAVEAFDGGSSPGRSSIVAGDIGRLWGLEQVRIGDRFGSSRLGSAAPQFPPPTLQSGVVAVDPEHGARLRVALQQLAEQDPLINVHQDGHGGMVVSLYGEVQKEVLQATLARDFAVDVIFRDSQTVKVERPVGVGEAVEVLHADSNPYLATLGFRIEPGRIGSGVEFRQSLAVRRLPLYVYNSAGSFVESMEGYVQEALRDRSRGWEVKDCVVTMTRCDYSSPDGPPSSRGPLSSPADFRKLTPLVLEQALDRAGVVVCEPMVRASIEVPTDNVGVVLAALARLGGRIEPPSTRGDLSVITTIVPADRLQHLQQQIPGLTGGEGVVESSFAGYEPITGRRARVVRHQLPHDATGF